MKIKTIDINALEWFDKVNGNSYFAGTVTINFGMDSQKEFVMPFQYGYGDQYKHEAFKQLVERKLVPVKDYKSISAWRYYEEKKIIVRSKKQENCKQRELKQLGK
jgi:preprotein translocase subunit SecF